MVDKSLAELLKIEWQEVRKNFYYPQLPSPKLVDSLEGGGLFDFRALQTTVGEDYVVGFREKNIFDSYGKSDKIVLNEVLSHELVHFMKYPGSFLNVLRMQKSAQGIADAETINRLRKDFVEAQTNLEMILKLKHEGTVPISRELNNDQIYPGSLGELHYALYQNLSNQDFGVNIKELGEEEKYLVKSLSEINFLDTSNQNENFVSFVELLKDYKPEQQESSGEEEGSSQGNGGDYQNMQGSGSGLEGNEENSDSNDNNLEGEERDEGNYQNNFYSCIREDSTAFTENQIREGLVQFAQECDLDEYEEIVKQVLQAGSKEDDSYEGLELTNIVGAGFGKGINKLANSFYSALAEKYTVPIREKSMEKGGGVYPYSHTNFQISDPIVDSDLFSTPGILPGITKKWIRKEGEGYSSEESIPDSFIIIDSSESMPDPNELISVPVLGATVISNAYFMNKSKVGVYNFSGEDLLCGLTNDQEKVHEMIRTYQNGGTYFNPLILENIFEDYGRPFDVSVVSDMDILNLDEFVESVFNIPQIHRVHLFYTDENYFSNVKKFRHSENISVLPLIGEKNISKIVMGEIGKSVVN